MGRSIEFETEMATGLCKCRWKRIEQQQQRQAKLCDKKEEAEMENKPKIHYTPSCKRKWSGAVVTVAKDLVGGKFGQSLSNYL